MNLGTFKGIVFALICFIFLAPSCKKETEATTYNFDQFKSQNWFYSAEEFSGDTVYFRPQSYEFPRSRGREGFIFSEEEGKMTYLAISPGDMPMKMDAVWRLEEGVLIFDIPGNELIGSRQLRFKIIEMNDEILKAVQIY